MLLDSGIIMEIVPPVPVCAQNVRPEAHVIDVYLPLHEMIKGYVKVVPSLVAVHAVCHLQELPSVHNVVPGSR